MRNTRKTARVTFGGVPMCALDAARKAGIPPGRIYWRVWKHGVTHQQALDALMGPNAYAGR